MLAVTTCRMILKHWKQRDSRIIGFLLLALSAKEMTQATLLYTPFALFMLYVLLAFLQKEEVQSEKEENRQTVLDYLIPSIVLVCYLGWAILIFLQNQDKSYQQQSISAWKKGKSTEAILLIEQTGEQTPNLINKGLLYMQCYLKTKNSEYLQAAEQNFKQAAQQQPEDIQIHYLLVRLYTHAQQLEKALPIANELAINYPKNSLYLSALSDILYQQGEKEAALQLLVSAICYTPRLLKGQRIQDLQQSDRVFYNSLQQHFSALAPSLEGTPADNARYGYIARWCGNDSIADQYLRKAISELPSLATPWHLLGDNDKYRLLLYGAFRKDLLSIKLPEEQEINDNLLFQATYGAKFENWYGYKLVPF